MPHRFPGKKLASLYAQPLEIALAFVLILSGLWITVYPEAAPGFVMLLGWPYTILFKCLMVIGGGLTLLGALPRRRWSKATEMLGMIAMGTVFGTYAGGLYDDGNSRATLAMATYAFVCAACFLKAYALYLEGRARLADIRRMPRPSQDEGH